MTWPPAGHDRQRELFSDDAEPCEPPEATREPRDGESYDRAGNIRPVPPGVGSYAEEVEGDTWTAGEAAAERAEEAEER